MPNLWGVNMASVQKIYADALFSLLESENTDKSGFDSVLSQLKAVGKAIAETPDFIKFMNTPTVTREEKLGLVDKAFAGLKQSHVYNFLRLLSVKGRMGHFPRILSTFNEMYNERFDIAEIIVTSSMPLTDSLKSKIVGKMASITGKTVSIVEKVDKSIIGGVVVDYGNTRLDGSVKTRLAELKKDMSGIIA